MTINEIISALRRGMLSDTLLRLAADTIEKLANENNRRKAEIDDLKRDTIPKLKHTLVRAYKCGLEVEKENQQLKAEVARLTLDLKMIQHTATKYPHGVLRENAAIFTESHEAYDKLISSISTEANIEFAERLKEKAFTHEIPFEANADKFVKLVAVEDIDNLLKERVGEIK